MSEKYPDRFRAACACGWATRGYDRSVAEGAASWHNRLERCACGCSTEAAYEPEHLATVTSLQ